jgi:uncharacterized protein
MKISAAILVVSLLSINPATAVNVWINEIHYDNAGADTGEFVEIAGAAGTDLSGFQLILYNGTDGKVYNTKSLSGFLSDQQNGFGVIQFSYPVNGIQNGNPDGVVLAFGSTLIQFLSYEGTFTGVDGVANGVLSSDIGVAEDGTTQAGYSLQLTGTGTQYGDFTWAGPRSATPGAVNAGQTFTVPDVQNSLSLFSLALGALYWARRFFKVQGSPGLATR